MPAPRRGSRRSSSAWLPPRVVRSVAELLVDHAESASPVRARRRFSQNRAMLRGRAAAMPRRCAASSRRCRTSTADDRAGSGSIGATSSAAPPRCPPRSARTIASPSTISPRVTLTSNAPGFIAAKRASSNSPRVSAVSGAPTATTSLAASRSSSRSIGHTVSTPSDGGTAIDVTGDHVHAEGDGAPGHRPARPPEADDAHRQPLELDLGHAHALALVPSLGSEADRRGDLAGQGQQQTEAGVGEVAAHETLLAGQHDGARRHLRVQEHVHARGDAVHPAQLRRSVEQRFGDETRR